MGKMSNPLLLLSAIRPREQIQVYETLTPAIPGPGKHPGYSLIFFLIASFDFSMLTAFVAIGKKFIVVFARPERCAGIRRGFRWIAVRYGLSGGGRFKRTNALTLHPMGVTPKSLQIFLHRKLLNSVCRGMVKYLLSAGLCHKVCFLPSLSSLHPFSERCFNSSRRFIW